MGTSHLGSKVHTREPDKIYLQEFFGSRNGGVHPLNGPPFDRFNWQARLTHLGWINKQLVLYQLASELERSRYFTDLYREHCVKYLRHLADEL